MMKKWRPSYWFKAESRIQKQRFPYDVIIFYNTVMGGVDQVDQRTCVYHPDGKFAIRFYLRIFFIDLMDVAYVNSYIA